MGRGSWLWKSLVVVVVLGGVLAVPALALMGRDAALESNAGRLVGVVTDPAAPGYQVIVEPTPTLLLVHTHADRLEAVTFMALSSATTGSALILPPALAVDTPSGPATLRDLHAEGGLPALVEAVEGELDIGIADFTADGALLDPDGVPIVEVDRDQWSQLVAPVAPLLVDNPDDVAVTAADGTAEAAFARGELSLAAGDVGPYLEARATGENDLNRMLRHQRFWEGWMEAVAAADPALAVPGEQESGLGLFVRTLASGEAAFLPVQASTYNIPGASESVFLVDEAWLGSLIPAMVPFPTAPEPGSRPLVEVLDGTGTPGASLAAAGRLTEVGAVIRAIGNGPTFDYVGTQILYYDPDQEEAALAMREALGAGTVELRENPDEVVTVTVILGTDVVDTLDR